MNTSLIGIDIGGTSIKGGLIAGETISRTATRPVNRNDAKQAVIDKVIEVAEELIHDGITGIGIGVPGLVDHKQGIIYDLHNIPSWDVVPLKSILEERFNIPVSINNDANCFAIGEKHFGSGKPYSNFLGITLGTGLGMGIIINEHLYSGVMSGAGELGMIPYKDGIMEHYTSSQFFKNKYNTTGVEVSELAAKGDKSALEMYNDFGDHLGDAFITIMHLFAPEAVIIGGAMSLAYPYFSEALHKKIDSFVLKRQIENFKVITTSNTQMGILGAAALCLDK